MLIFGALLRRASFPVACCLAVSLSACAGDATNATPGISLSIPATAMLYQGDVVKVDGTLFRLNFADSVQLNFSGVPEGVSVTPELSPVTGGLAMWLTISPATVPGVYQIRVTGSATGVPSVTKSLELTVRTPAVLSLFADTGLFVVPPGSSTVIHVAVERSGFTGAIQIKCNNSGGWTMGCPATVYDNNFDVTFSPNFLLRPGSEYWIGIQARLPWEDSVTTPAHAFTGFRVLIPE